MFLEVITLVAGLFVLMLSADKFVDSASYLAFRLNVSPLFIGMIIIGLGTSLPEVLVSSISALEGNPALALGNAYGSNISNIALILGIVLLLTPLTIASNLLRKELPILLFVTLVSVALLINGILSRIDAIILLILLALFLMASFWQASKDSKESPEPLAEEISSSLEEHPQDSIPLTLLKLAGSMIVLMISAKFLVWAVIGIAQALGVSDLIIGLTVVAIGTSLPELAASISAVRKKEHELIIGNIIGSNIFNTLLVVGIAGVIHPINVESDSLYRDLPVMVGVTLLLFLAGFKKGNKISKGMGFFLLSIYVAYMIVLAAEVLN